MKSRIFALLTALLLIAALALPASAASSITFNSKESVTISGGSEYHETDLFATFKNVMPGDALTETVTIYNKIPASSYINAYLQVVPHNDEAQADYSRVQANADGKTGEDMAAFLSQLTLEVRQGNTVIFSGPASQAQDSVNLGKINKGRTMELSVTLTVPIDMGNEYRNHVGEVDWVIYADIIEGNNLIQTGQMNWPIPVLGTLGCVLVFLGVWMDRKKKKNA